jgi:hypothetical protein
MGKTDAGLKMLRDRRNGLSPRQRAALILIDGHRTLEAVLAATAAGGITRADIAQLVDQGLVAELAPGELSGSAPSLKPAAASATARDRYLRAYSIATEITAGLARKDSSLALAVEAAATLGELQALAGRVRAVVPPSQFARLKAVLRDG